MTKKNDAKTCYMKNVAYNYFLVHNDNGLN
jgi:hypothetical protein